MDYLAKQAREPENATYGVLTGEPSLREAFAEDVRKTYQTEKVEDLVSWTYARDASYGESTDNLRTRT
jgi:hypothetical protein